MLCDNITVNDSLQGVNAGLRNVSGELRDASTQVGVFGRDSEKLKGVQEALSKQYELHAKKVDIYKESIEKTGDKMQDNIKERDKLKSSLDDANKSYEKAVELYGEESTQAQEAKEQVSELSGEYEKKEVAVEANAKAIERHEGNLSRANAQMARTQGELNKINAELELSENKWITTGEVLENTGKKMEKTGKGMTTVGNNILKATAPLIGMGIAALKVSADFESSMSEVEAVSGATGAELKLLEDKAKEMGKATSKSATESAEALKYMSLAGWDVQESLDGLEPILRISEAGNINLATASDLTTDSMAALGLEVGELPIYLDKVAQSQASANTSAEEMLEAYVIAGGTFNNLNVDLDTSAALLGILANRGIKGSEAGNALNSTLTNLSGSTDKSKKMFEELGVEIYDQEGNYKGIENVLGDLSTAFEGMTEEEQNYYKTQLVGKNQLDTLNALLAGTGDEYDALKGEIEGAEGAAAEMAETMQDNLQGQMTKLKSELEGVGLQLGETLIPMARDFIGVVSDWTQRFADLSPKTQEMIVKGAGLAVGLGLLLSVGGKVVSGAGTLVKVTGLVAKGIGLAGTASTVGATAIGGVGTAAGAASGAAGLGGMVAGLGGVVVAAAPFLLAGAAIAGVGYAIHKGLSQEVVPEVDLFADKIETTAGVLEESAGSMGQSMEVVTTEISEGTKEAVGAYMELNDGAKESLDGLYINSTTITEEIKEDMIAQYKGMGEQVINQLEQDKEEELATLTKFFENSESLTHEEQQQILIDAQLHNNKEQLEVQQSQEQIEAILAKASKEKRALTREEKEEINQLQEEQKVKAVNVLSEQEVEAQIILERMKEYDGRITAEQASEHIKNLNEQRDGAVDAANEEYEQTVAAIIKQRDESGTISAEQAEMLIKDAQDQRDGVIEKAEETRDGAIEKIKEQSKGIEDSVDLSTGNILTQWDKLKTWWENWKPKAKEFIANTKENNKSQYSYTPSTKRDGKPAGSGFTQRWTGDDNFQGGLTTLHEKGFEVYDLPQGTRIYNHEASQEQVMKTAEAVARRIVNNDSGGGKGTTQNVTINSPNPISPYEVARQLKNVDKELAMGI